MLRMPPGSSTATPAQAADLIVQLRELLLASAGDGRLGKDGDTLIATLDTAQQAITQGDMTAATTRLGILLKRWSIASR